MRHKSWQALLFLLVALSLPVLVYADVAYPCPGKPDSWCHGKDYSDVNMFSVFVKVFALALVITLILELIVAFVFLLVAKKPRRVLKNILIANLISLPIVWLVPYIFPVLVSSSFAVLYVLVSEIFVVIFEAVFITWRSRGVLSIFQVASLVVFMNFVSLVFGYLIFAQVAGFLSF